MVKLKVGDVVSLKSGGPEMVIEMLGGVSDASVVWFDREGNFRREILDTRVLEGIERDVEKT